MGVGGVSVIISVATTFCLGKKFWFGLKSFEPEPRASNVTEECTDFGLHTFIGLVTRPNVQR